MELWGASPSCLLPPLHPAAAPAPAGEGKAAAVALGVLGGGGMQCMSTGWGFTGPAGDITSFFFFFLLLKISVSMAAP